MVGAAGAGKTTMLRSVAATCTAAGRDVVVLTLSAAAARVVTDESGLAADTIAGWRVGAVDMPRGGVVIVDEASMVPTLVLDQMIRVAGTYGSKVALIGDFAQMGAPEAGGLLRDLAALPSTVELTAVRRFVEPWEADASVQLRARQPAIAATYEAQGRIVESTTDAVFDDAAAAWWSDTDAGQRSLVVVDTANDAAEVNTRCQQHLIVAGKLGDHVADDAAGCRIHIGDLVQTRRNTRDVPTSDHRRILNRDVWNITGIDADGALHVTHAHRPAAAVLPSAYVRADVVLGYATTIAGAQGRTVDAGHVVVTPRTTSASLYVGMTRGSESNHAHVVCDSHDHTEFALGDLSGRQAFAAASIRDADGQLSAHAIRQRWEAGRVDRATARAADRRRRTVTTWSTARERNLPPAIRAALADQHHLILEVLVRLPNHDSRRNAIAHAASPINWRQPAAVEQFLRRLNGHRRGTLTSAWRRVAAPGSNAESRMARRRRQLPHTLEMTPV